MEEGKLEPFCQHGMPGKLIEISADEVLDAIAEERDIRVEYALIIGDLNIRGITSQGDILIQSSEIRGKTNFACTTFKKNADFSDTTFIGGADFKSATFRGHADFIDTTFSRDAFFNSANFIGDADFSGTTFKGYVKFMFAFFKGYANFKSATFSKDAFFNSANFIDDADFSDAVFGGCAYFGYATFIGDTHFGSADFSVRANFFGTHMKHPAGFKSVRFQKNKVFAGLWNHILRPLFWPITWFLTIGKVKLSEKPVTDFSRFNTTTIMDGSSNPYLKRYIDDEQWIASWRERSRLCKILFILWEATSHCGRSIGLWAFWSAAIAVAFAFIYRGFGCDSIAFNVDKLNGVQPDLLSYLYYSVVTFTTLGFGDIVPLTNWARFFVGAEVVLGYVMLGGLISIFANKFARRS